MEVRTLCRGSGRGGIVTIVLIPRGGRTSGPKLGLIHLHSHVLTSHTNFFGLRSDEGRDDDSPSGPVQFYLEANSGVQYYFECFSNMYSPFQKSFGRVEHGLELLQVASQIDFRGLMERISLYLSSVLWTQEEERKVRRYAASENFPRTLLKDLVSRLGLDESEEDRQKQSLIVLNGVLEASGMPTVVPSTAVMQGFQRAPPFACSRWIVAMLNQEAVEVFCDIDRDCEELLRTPSNRTSRDFDNFRMFNLDRIRAVSWILEALLKGQVAEELVQGIAHLENFAEFIRHVPVEHAKAAGFSKRDFAELVLVMYKEVVAGRLVLKPSERMALLANWHAVLKSSLAVGAFEQAAADLFLTLPLKQQRDLIELQRERVRDFISTSSLPLVLRFHCE